MNELVYIKREDAFTTSLIIAEGTEVQHKSVLALIRKHRKDFEELGKVEFSDLKSLNPQGGRPIKIVPLNEQQATLLVTYMDNTPVVREFKKRLVQDFFKMRSILMERKTDTWLDARQRGKLTRRLETDIIQQLIPYAEAQGSENASKTLYMVYTRLAKKMAAVEDRSATGVKQLVVLDMVESLIIKCIQEGMARELHYKEIYQDCKSRLEQFRSLTYLEVKA